MKIAAVLLGLFATTQAFGKLWCWGCLFERGASSVSEHGCM